MDADRGDKWELDGSRLKSMTESESRRQRRYAPLDKALTPLDKAPTSPDEALTWYKIVPNES